MAKIRCEKCGKKFYVINSKAECPFCSEKGEKSTVDNKNTVANLIKILGWCILAVGFFGGIIIGQSLYENGISELNYIAMFISWLSCGIASILFFALAEVIQILHDIRFNLLNKKKEEI